MWHNPALGHCIRSRLAPSCCHGHSHFSKLFECAAGPFGGPVFWSCLLAEIRYSMYYQVWNGRNGQTEGQLSHLGPPFQHCIHDLVLVKRLQCKHAATAGVDFYQVHRMVILRNPKWHFFNVLSPCWEKHRTDHNPPPRFQTPIRTTLIPPPPKASTTPWILTACWGRPSAAWEGNQFSGTCLSVTRGTSDTSLLFSRSSEDETTRSFTLYVIEYIRLSL